jgi:dUTPase
MLTNAKIVEAQRNGEIEITNYNPEHLGLYYYILTPAKVITGQTWDDDSVLLDNARKENLTDFPFPIASGKNVTVVFKERIILSKKYYGVLFACSLCIEAGLHLTFGEIEPEYNNELRIGITNMGAEDFVLRPISELVKVRFEKFPEDASFLPLPAERKAYKERIEYLRGMKRELQRKAEEEIKKIDDQLEKELSVR